MEKKATYEDPEELKSRWLKTNSKNYAFRDIALYKLKKLCKKGAKNRPSKMDLRGVNLSGEDLSELDLSRYDFSLADLSEANLRNSNLSWTRMIETNFHKANLDKCEMMGSDFSMANLNECSIQNSGLGGANLSGASFINSNLSNTSLSKSDLSNTDFRAANLFNANLTEACLKNAAFIRAKLIKADLKSSNVKEACFELADMRQSRILGLKNFKKAGWIGADIRDIDLRGAHLINRFINDENYLYEFRTLSKYHEIIYFLWWITSDCGRSLFRWVIFVFLIVVFFGFSYSIVGVDFGRYKTAFSPYYFSIVTLTTLGYGDAVPQSLGGQILTILEAILGYIGLGGLLTILTNKMARRAE